MILNQKASQYEEVPDSVFDNDEEKKLFYLTRYNTLINKEFPQDIEKAAERGKNLLVMFTIILSSQANLWLAEYQTEELKKTDFKFYS